MNRVFSTDRPAVRGVTHMVSSGHYLASAAGYRVLEDGGNAVDAGVAAGIVLGVSLPNLVSFGGVAPIALYMAEKDEVSTISGLGRWPRGVTIDYLVERAEGGVPPPMLQCVVPAACDAWLTALERYGTMTFEQVVTPALELCETGFVIQGILAHELPKMDSLMNASPGLRKLLMPNGRRLEQGDLLVQRELARTFGRLIEAERACSSQGREKAIRATRDYFYKGAIAREIVDFCQANGGLLTYQDMADFGVKLESPQRGEYRGYTVYTCGPWCQGPALIEVLNILEGYDLTGMGHNSADYIHVVTEAIKLTFSDRHYYFGDPEFVAVPIAGLLSKEYARERQALIKMEMACPEMPEPGDPFRYQPDPRPAFKLAPRPEPKGGPMPQDTSYVCVVDKWGNGFSATPSDAYQNLIPSLGLSISPRGSQSWLEADHPSCVAPWKRPRLTPNPAIAFRDGKLFMLFGTPGGDVQVQAMTQFFLNVVEFNWSPQQAVEAPRFASYSFPGTEMDHPYKPGGLSCESQIDPQVLEALAARGHKVEDWGERNSHAGALCAIQVDSERGTLTGGADSRRDSYAIGR